MHTFMQGQSSQSGKMCYSHLTFVCCTVTPNSNVSAVLSLVSVSLFLTHFSSRGSSYVEMQWNKGMAKQRREGGREGGREGWGTTESCPDWWEASKNAFRKKCITTLHCAENLTLSPVHCFTLLLFCKIRIFQPPFILSRSFSTSTFSTPKLAFLMHCQSVTTLLNVPFSYFLCSFNSQNIPVL